MPVVVVVLVAAGAGALLLKAAATTPPAPSPLPTASLPSAASDDLYVAPTGDDRARGDEAAPLLTIQAAADRAAPGSTIWLATGEYAGFTANASGVEGAPITVAAMTGAQPVIRAGARAATIDLSGAHDLSLVGLEVEGPTGQALAAIKLERSTRVTVSGCTVQHAEGGFGIEVRFSADVTIRGNEIAHNAVGVRLYGEGDPASVHDVLIEQNAIHDSDSMIVNDAAPDNDFGGNAIIWHKVSGTTIARDNQVWGNRAASHDYGTDGGAFEIWGSSNMTITGNTAWDNVNVLETGSDGPPCDRITFTRNTAFVTSRGVGLILRCASDSLFAHNVLDGVKEYAFELSDRSGGNIFANSIAGLRIVDNIVVRAPLYAIRNPLPASVTLDYNLAWPVASGVATLPGRVTAFTLAELTRATGFEAHGVMADPRFVDEATGDYHLREGSPAVDRGVILEPGEPYLGAGPDIGRYEGPAALPSPS